MQRRSESSRGLHTGTRTVDGRFHPECFLFVKMQIYTVYIRDIWELNPQALS